MAVQESRLIRKNADFSTLIGCHANDPWDIKQRGPPDQSSAPKMLSFDENIAKIGQQILR